MQYWTHLYTPHTWAEFLSSGGTVTGFPERRWATVQTIQRGDLILCYLIGLSRYVGVLEVTGDPFLGYKPIWAERLYPARLPVHIKLELLPEYGVPVQALGHELSYFKEDDHPRAWTYHFRSAPILETVTDAEAVLNALEIAGEDPTYRAVDSRQLIISNPRLYESKSGTVTIPDSDLLDPEVLAELDDDPFVTHEEIQWLLLKTGAAMGLDVWVARNDRGRSFEGQPFAKMPRLLDELPRQFDPATQRTVELIDVLWLKDKAILAAFEVEHTSAIYSGLLRMGDLVAMQPNLQLKLYIVAPDERREKVYSEINRPIFARLKLNDLCQYIPYSGLRNKIAQVQGVLPYLNPDFLNEIAERVRV